MQQIANRITELREARGLSETRLATESAIPRMTFQRRMVDPSSFTISELDRVAAALNTRLDALLYGSAA